MPSLPYELYTTEQIREIEKIAIAQLNISSYELMQRAAKVAFMTLTKTWPKAKKLLVFCGGGNNGGDGYELARLAKEAGLSVAIYYVSDPKQLTDAAKLAYLASEQAGVNIKVFENNNDIAMADVVIDALLGTGLKGQIKENYQQAIAAINCAEKPVLAIDIASGLNADSGSIQACAVKATMTITFIGLKTGLFTGAAANVCGQIVGDDLQIPRKIFETIKPVNFRINFFELQNKYLKPRKRNAYKTCFGHALIAGGDLGMAGAVIMSGIACARTGAGLTSVATRSEHIAAVVSAEPALMAKAINNTNDLQQLINKATAIGLGPGLGQSSWSATVFNLTIKSVQPMVIDADGLNLLAQNKFYNNNWILTPHPGEAARLLGCSSAEIEADRFKAVKQIQQNYGGVIILKGAGTLIADAKNIYVCDAGNPGMASGGMGDVLTGIIVGLLAQKIPLSEAAQLAVMLHAKAADLAAADLGERGLLALDLMRYLQQLVNRP